MGTRGASHSLSGSPSRLGAEDPSLEKRTCWFSPWCFRCASPHTPETQFKTLCTQDEFSDRTVFRNHHITQIIKVQRSNKTMWNYCKKCRRVSFKQKSYFFCWHFELHELCFSTKNMPRSVNLHKAHTRGLSLKMSNTKPTIKHFTITIMHFEPWTQINLSDIFVYFNVYLEILLKHDRQWLFCEL